MKATRYVILSFLAFSISIFAQTGRVHVTVDQSLPVRGIVDRQPVLDPSVHPVEMPHVSASNLTKQRPHVTNDLFEIGKMANTYCTLGQNRCQIACDPATNSVAVVFRGNDRSPQGNGNSLYVRYSSDGGATWTDKGPNVAAGQTNPSGLSSPRYPEVFLYNPTQSRNISDVKVSLLWPQVMSYGSTTTWGEVHNMSSAFGSKNPVYNKWPSPPNWLIPMQVVPDYINNRLITFIQWVDPSTGTGSREYIVMVSTDAGATWSALDPNFMPAWTTNQVPSNNSAYSLSADVSPDGTHMIMAYISADIVENSVMYLSENHRIAWVESTDGGVTWSFGPEYISLSDIPDRPSPMELNPRLGLNLDVIYDSQNEPHFLVTATTDLNPFNPFDETPTNNELIPEHNDSTYICEVTRKNGEWQMNLIARIRKPVVRRRAFSIRLSSGAEIYETIYNEPHWARDIIGLKVYAKWIDCDSTWKFPYVRNNALLNDTIQNVWVAGRDIRSNTYGGGWSLPQKVTNGTEVAAKYSKLAHFAGNNGEMHVIFTEWGYGDYPDGDPVNADNTVWYIKNVRVDATVPVERESSPVSFRLEQNFPNPFGFGSIAKTSTTMISYTVKEQGRVVLEVLDPLGRLVKTLVDGETGRGRHVVRFEAGNLPSGPYFYRLRLNGRSVTRTMFHLR
ncbi:MAG: exo-alpha-sialidase [Chlorobi bacterium]|nr:exo-alpha-sialidase [Chlorobiota bacterium]